jgi:hypothetical protein
MRYYIGVDWADTAHAIWVEDEQGDRVLTRAVPHTAEGFAEWGRWLDEQRASGVALWVAIERPMAGSWTSSWTTGWWSIPSTPRPWTGRGTVSG